MSRIMLANKHKSPGSLTFLGHPGGKLLYGPRAAYISLCLVKLNFSVNLNLVESLTFPELTARVPSYLVMSDLKRQA